VAPFVDSHGIIRIFVTSHLLRVALSGEWMC